MLRSDIQLRKKTQGPEKALKCALWYSTIQRMRICDITINEFRPPIERDPIRYEVIVDNLNFCDKCNKGHLEGQCAFCSTDSMLLDFIEHAGQAAAFSASSM